MKSVGYKLQWTRKANTDWNEAVKLCAKLKDSRCKNNCKIPDEKVTYRVKNKKWLSNLNQRWKAIWSILKIPTTE